MVQTMTPLKANVLTGERPSTLGQQFTPYTGGPEEARERHRSHAGYPVEGIWKDKPPEQGQLFDPETVARPEAHQQTPDQFAQDPRTWWHGRVTKGGPKGRLGGSTIGRGEGFHAGTEAAARQRVSHNVKVRGLKEGMAGHMYPLRITGPVEGPEAMREDVSRHIELGPARYRYGSTVGGRKKGYLYEQAVESPGSISVGVPQRKGFLATQREMVASAKAQGKFVHPNIQWAVGKAPEHTAEEIRPRPPRYQEENQQPGLAHALLPPHGVSDPAAVATAASMYEQLNETEPIQRRTYQTESGKRQHVWKDVSGPDVLGNQWMPQ